MARSEQITEDPLMVANFALRELDSPPVAASKRDPIIRDAKIMAQSIKRTQDFNNLIGFQTISMPEVGIELRDVVEGNWPYPHRVPITRAQTSDVTLTQAVFRNSSDFYAWIFQALWGRGAPRRNFAIVHLGRGGRVGEALDVWAERRTIRLLRCVPVTWKPGSDFDANAAEVSLEELTMHVERIDLEIGPAAQKLFDF